MLWRRHQNALLGWIHRRLGAGAARGDLGEEIAARVWASLCYNDRRRLHQFDPARGDFPAYLIGMAEAEVCLLHRRKGRGSQAREVGPVGHDVADGPTSCLSPEALLEDCQQALTERERWFVSVHLVGIPGNGPTDRLSACAFRKLKQRVQQKLQAHLRSA
jgi:hypothetical protein